MLCPNCGSDNLIVQLPGLVQLTTRTPANCRPEVTKHAAIMWPAPDTWAEEHGNQNAGCKDCGHRSKLRELLRQRPLFGVAP